VLAPKWHVPVEPPTSKRVGMRYGRSRRLRGQTPPETHHPRRQSPRVGEANPPQGNCGGGKNDIPCIFPTNNDRDCGLGNLSSDQEHRLALVVSWSVNPAPDENLGILDIHNMLWIMWMDRGMSMLFA